MANLTCTAPINPNDHSSHGAHHGHGSPSTIVTKPSCWADDNAFLPTLAYCINTRCKSVSVVAVERYWKEQVPVDPSVPPE
ncbi:unnamed protein product [Periconia digitata]|uniref:Uncharacterized protein n=1 Tax=Periconia digitata TaxID=1303443 RepID=A0A9W4UJA9_9PLEO|nr:unnamed protein product [Periconia digitata]